MHELQPEEGSEGRAHQPSEGCLRQSPAAGARDRAAHLAAGRLARLQDHHQLVFIVFVLARDQVRSRAGVAAV